MRRVSEGKRSSLCSNPNVVPTIDQVLNEIEKPIRFSSKQLKIATNSFSDLLGAGATGSVYKGTLPSGLIVAVKVLNGSSKKKVEDQFLAEVSTIGTTHHINLVQLYGFCFESDLRALVYEYMENASLDRLLFNKENIEWEKLNDIAIGTAKGIAYLHEDCQQRIIHYDIKPENILLDVGFCPKVADFGLAKLCDRKKTHMTLTGNRGTPGYAAPEMWMPYPVTQKCDVYSFGMLLFEILGRRRNFDLNLPESQEWFPKWVWKKFDKGKLSEVMDVCAIEEMDRGKAGRMAVIALCCVQYNSESRPLMSEVVKMLEGGVDIPIPKNPFPCFFEVTDRACGLVPGSTRVSTETDYSSVSPVVRNNEIEIVTT
ncbi:hypothetical protein LguiB_020798 [Lonicera macranthoides]